MGLLLVGTSEEVLAHDEYIETTEKAPSNSASDQVVDGAWLEVAESAEEGLKFVPGLWLSRHGSAAKGPQLFWRGFDAAHGTDIEMKWGHIPLNEPSNIHGHGYLDLGFLRADLVKAIRVEPGAFGLSQGAFANAGTVWFEPGKTTSHAGVQGDSLGGLALSAGVGADSHDAFVWLSRSPGYGERRAYESAMVAASSELWSSDELRLVQRSLIYASRFDTPGVVRNSDFQDGRLGFYDSYLSDEREWYAGHLPQGQSTRALGALELNGKKAHLAGFLGLRGFEVEENFGGIDQGRLQSDLSLRMGVDGHKALRLGDGWQLELLGRAERISSRQSESGRAMDGQFTEVSQAFDIEQTFGALGVGLSGLPMNSLRVEVGGRAEFAGFRVEDRLNSDEGDEGIVVLVPRSRAQFFATQHITLFAAYGHGLRPPEARAVLSDEFRSGFTTSKQAEIGARWDSETVSASLGAFGILVDDELLYDHISGLSISQDKTERVGGEAGVELRPLKYLRLRGDAAYTNARFSESGAPVPGAPRFMANAWVLGDVAGFETFVHAFYMAERPLANGAEAAAILLVDLGSEYAIDQWRLGLRVFNVLNSRWRSGEYHFASQWSTTSKIPVLHYSAGEPIKAELSVRYEF